MSKLAVPGLLLILSALPATAGSPAIDTIDALQLMAWLDSPDPPLVLDVRGRQSYRAGTLPGAFDVGSDPMGYLPDHGGDPMVLLAPEDFDPRRLAAWRARLVNRGHPVWLLLHGMAGWIAAGGRVEQPETVYTRPGRVPFLIPKGLCEGGEPAQVFE